MFSNSRLRAFLVASLSLLWASTSLAVTDPATYYATLVADWNLSSASSGAMPSGVAGTSLFGLTTTDKLAAINAWTVTGTIPTTYYVTGSQIINCINYAEFESLTAPIQQQLMSLFATPGQLLGGTANTAYLTVALVVQNFPNNGPTINCLSAAAKALVEPWYIVPAKNSGGGLNGPVNSNDLTAAAPANGGLPLQ